MALWYPAQVIANPSARGAGEDLSVNLRTRISRGDGSWRISERPPPDDTPPEESLARILADTGLEMRSVELVYAAPALEPLLRRR